MIYGLLLSIKVYYELNNIISKHLPSFLLAVGGTIEFISLPTIILRHWDHPLLILLYQVIKQLL